MKKNLIKIGLFAFLSFVIQHLIYNAPIESMYRERVESPNNCFNIITGGFKSFFVQLYIGDELIYSDFESNAFTVIKWKVLKSTSCKIIYTTDEDSSREIIHKFDIDETESTIYLILTQEEEFIFERIPSLEYVIQ